MAATIPTRLPEIEGNEVSTSFQVADKRVAIVCWQQAVDAAGVDDKVLADDCGISRGYYSKVASGQQGDLLDLAYRLPVKHAAIRADWFRRMSESEQIDPVEHAAEQVAAAAIRFLRLRARVGALRMAKSYGHPRPAKAAVR